MQIAIVETLYNIFITTYLEELSDLSIGYSFNTKRLEKLDELFNAIDYINNSYDVSKNTVIKLIEYYDN